ncbi:PepSY domain-containing protein [Oceanobacillus sojae]|uniref:PepSY domain-containing protein n=1 Tax=Oceanobacillus sojae TaxID=582851 RepID=UPI0021A7AAC6|nr:PepSY domain-containing protein [Oceanobacillus sojae]MCT1902608.1 PepSY domain-containing protein [Oceanobacillus sojae]
MKKTLLLCLTLLLSITLAACGTSDDSSTENDTTNDSDTSENANDNNADSNTEGESTDTNDNSGATGGNDGLDLTSVSLSVEDAVSAFQEKFTDARVSSIQLDEERGELVYDIDGFDDSMEYSAEINQSGEIIAEEQEQQDADDRYEELALDDYITAEEALSTASEASEADGITARGWSLEFENGSPVYEINFEDMGSQEVDVYIDAESGEQLHVEVDD